MGKAFIIGFAFAMLCHQPAAAITFQRGGNVSVSRGPLVVATGDFNNDGKVDLAVGSYYCVHGSCGTVSVLLGDGHGGFAQAIESRLGKYILPAAIVSADLNKDGRLDLIVASNGLSEVLVLLGNGDGSFQPAVPYTTGSETQSVTVGDFNQDGIPDLAAVCWNEIKNVAVLLGNGDGTFQPALHLRAGSTAVAVTTSDFNGDGHADLAVASMFSSSVYILLGNGDGSFGEAVGYTTATSPRDIATGDFNHDGKLDVVIPGGLLLGNGNGTFQEAASFNVGDLAPKLTVADFDNDGNLDVATSDADNGGKVYVVLGNGNGTFKPSLGLTIGNTPWGVAAADFTGDGAADLAVTNSLTDKVAILVNTGN
jgi:VCBS repeat protein/FG-GAP repeat protein